MPRTYSLAFENQNISSAAGDHDLFEIGAPDDMGIEIVGLTLYCLTELGDAQDEWLRLAIIRGHTTSSNGTSTSARQLDPNDQNASVSSKVVGTVPASLGTSITLWAGGMNVRAGFEMFFPDGCGPRTVQTSGGLIVVRMLSNVVDDLSMSGTLFFKEL